MGGTGRVNVTAIGAMCPTFNISHNATLPPESFVRTYLLLLQTWICLIPGAPAFKKE